MEIKPNMIIRCETYKEAFELCKKVIKNKSLNYILQWAAYWKVYKSATCYQVNGECNDFYWYGDVISFGEQEIHWFSKLFNETTDNKEVLPNMSKVDLGVFIRNKTIDEFVEKLIGRLEENRRPIVTNDEDLEWNRAMYLCTGIANQLAEEMKK